MVTKGAGGVSSTLATRAWDPAGHVFVDGREDVFPQVVADTFSAIVTSPTPPSSAWLMRYSVSGLRPLLFPRADISEADLKAWLKTRIARYKVPREIVFWTTCRVTREARC